MRSEVDLLEKLQQVSYRIITREEEISKDSKIEIPKQILSTVFSHMYNISQKVNEYKFNEKMKCTMLREVTPNLGIDRIIFETKKLVMYVEDNYYIELARTVVAFLEGIIKDDYLLDSSPDYNHYNIEMNFLKYTLSQGYNLNVKIKQHKEYSKVCDLITSREDIIRFFHGKYKLEDYLYEELEQLIDMLLEYEKRLADVELVEDEKLKSMLFQNFYFVYGKRLDYLFKLNDM